MTQSVTAQQSGCQGNSLALMVRQLRTAIDGSSWSHDALAKELGISESYLSRCLSGEKPMTPKLADKLPLEIKRAVVTLFAQHVGLIVVAPIDYDAALQQVTAIVLAVKLTPAKAELRSTVKEQTR